MDFNGVTKSHLIRLRFFTSFLLPFILTITATAQWGGGPPSGFQEKNNLFAGGEEYRQTVDPFARLDSVKFGESWSEDTGEISFSQTDLSVPGNFELPVAITRTRSRSPIGYYASGEFGDWELSLPKMEYTWRDAYSHLWEPTRCSNVTPNYVYDGNQPYTDIFPGNWYSGISVSGFEGSTGYLLKTNSSWPTSTLGSAPTLTTKDYWKIGCLPAGSNGRQGFTATSPNGITYTFDQEVHRRLIKDNSWVDGDNHKITIYPSVVTDSDGNTVTYTYGAHGPTQISSSDGRLVTLTYRPEGQISSITFNNRTWNYTYTTIDGREILTSVTRPDGESWTFTNLHELEIGMGPDQDYLDCVYVQPGIVHGIWSWTPGDVVSTVSMIAPSGGVLSFELTPKKNGRKWGPSRMTPNYWYTNRCYQSVYHLDNHFVSLAATKKTIDALNGTPSVWTYDYEEDEGNYASESGLLDEKTRTVYNPDGSRTELKVNRRHNSLLEGLTVLRETYSAHSGGTVLQSNTSTIDYISHLNGYYDLPNPYMGVHTFGGSTMRAIASQDILSNVVQQDGDTYTTEYEYDRAAALNKPTTVKKFSNVSTSPRIIETEYHHNTSNWVLGLPKKVEINSRLETENFYDSYGRLNEIHKYGNLHGKYSYHTTFGYKGAIRWMEDALQNRCYLNDWKFGNPQHIITPENDNIYQTFDNNGWLTSSTDAKGQITTYSRDNMGRLTTYNPPIQSSTSISYSFPSSGGATQTITRGPRVETITYDALFRPTLVDVGNQIYTKTTYNEAGQKVFESFPSSSSHPTNGTHYTYDGLGRIKTQSTSAGMTEHRYMSSHRHSVIDPSGKWTDYYSYGYDGPDNKNYRAITEHQSGTIFRTTNIYNNVWGETTQIRQRGTFNNYNVDKSQYLYYDSRRRVCRYRTKEGGDTVFAYDDAGWLTSYQKGLSNGSSCTAPSGGAKVTLTRDALGRVTTTNFADSHTPDIYRTYDANGNVLTTKRGGADWTYAYNAVNQLTSETLAIDGRTYPLTYTYDGHGRLNSRKLPTGRPINLTFDALGRVTQSTGWGSVKYSYNMSYHPDGQVAGYASQNGQVYTKTLNALMQPTRVQSYKGGQAAFDRSYQYDNRGLITHITDHKNNSYSQSFAYDGLGQLVSANGKWGTGTFKYDSLGNIRQKKLGSRTVNMSYNSLNRLASYTDSGSGPNKSLSYDSRGNVTALGALSFVYDHADQPRAVSGSANGTYHYDGNLKRVKSVVNGRTTYNIYDAAGRLVHVDKRAGGGQGEMRTDYITVSGMLIARVDTGIGYRYLHTDHLGSTSVGTASNGNVLWEEYNTPFGEVMSSTPYNDDQAAFTGHIRDSATGLIYMQARYYDPVIGRFLSVDPVTFMDTGHTGMFNRYAYTWNNPVNIVDPDGLQACQAIAGDKGSDCFEASNYKKGKVQDDSTVTQSEDITSAVNGSAGFYETSGYDEDVFEIEDTPEGATVRQNFSETTDKKLSTSFTPSDGKIDAINHTHPTDKSNAAPGPADDNVVRKLGVPNNVTHGSGHSSTVGHVGMVKGQFYFKVTRGKLSSGERDTTRKHLREYQRRNQK